MKPIALITGATSGFGKATAERFAREGWNIIITGRREERLIQLKN
ncbi:MAG: SDR family NAD(P)-dependent oxidoreductase, partial [Flavobacteriales bacterium]